MGSWGSLVVVVLAGRGVLIQRKKLLRTWCIEEAAVVGVTLEGAVWVGHVVGHKVCGWSWVLD